MHEGHCRKVSETYVLSSFFVKFFKFRIENTLFLELVIGLVQIECRPSILNRVMRVHLNLFSEYEPRKKSQR